MTDLSVLSASEAVRFLVWLDPTGLHNLVAIDPVSGAVEAETFDFAGRGKIQAASFVSAHNSQRNLYFSINAPSGSARPSTKLRRDEIGAVRAFHVDLDEVPEGYAWGDPAEDCAPSAVIDSGNGLWGFWKLAEPVAVNDAADVAAIEAQNRALVAKFGGDKQAFNLDRIARLPGTINIPNKAKRAKGRVECPTRTVATSRILYTPERVAAWVPPAAILTETAKSKAEAAAVVDPNEIDTPTVVRDCLAYLDRETLVAVNGGGGRKVTIDTLHALMDRGASPDMAATLGLYRLKTEGEDWTLEALKKLARGLNRELPIGARIPELVATTEFSDETGNAAAQPATLSRPMSLERIGAIVDEPFQENEFLVDEWLDAQSLCVMYGESNTGKTHVALDMAMALATRKNWAGYEVRNGLVVYVAAEGGRGIKNRIKGHFLARPEIDWKKAPFELLRYPLNLHGTRNDAKALVRLIKEAEDFHGVKCEHFTLDTLSRTMPGGNENSPEDMTAYVSCVDYLREALGSAGTVVHHAGKNTAKGARGHSSLRAATDTELEVANMEVVCRKQRDLEGGKTLRFEYRPFVVGQDSRGKDRTTVIADVRAPTEFDRRMLTPQQQKVLDAIRDLTEAKTQETQKEGGSVMPERQPSFARKDLAHLGMASTTITEVLGVLTEEGFIANPKRGLYIPTRMTE